MDKHLAQAYTAGRWAREAGRERVPPTYAPNALGKPLRDEWDRGYMSLGPLTETKRKSDMLSDSSLNAGLKKCPFCGADAIVKRNKTVMVSCTKCSASTFQILEDRLSAPKQWNRRVKAAK